MSIAFHLTTIRIVKVKGLEGREVLEGSFWKRGNLRFRHQEKGSVVRSKLPGWAEGLDQQGQTYLLWEASDLRGRALVIQPWESCYCFEVSPVNSGGEKSG